MRDANYGFQAISHRFQVLDGDPTVLYEVPENKKVDLARLLKDIYGDEYIGDPRMQKLFEKNDILPLDFLSGKDEATALDNSNIKSCISPHWPKSMQLPKLLGGLKKRR